MAKKIKLHHFQGENNYDYKVVVDYYDAANQYPETLYSNYLNALCKFAENVSILSVVKNVNIYTTKDDLKIKGY